MAVAYTPGLAVKHHTALRKERKLPILGEVLVKQGQQVLHDTVVAKTDLPGNVRSLNVANMLGIPPQEVPQAMLVQEGGQVEEGQVLARIKTMFGLFTKQTTSPITGTVENISHVTGQVLLREPPIPVSVSAYVSGTVTAVLPKEGVVLSTEGAFIQGIFGVGGETHGPIAVVAKEPGESLQRGHLSPDLRGKVVVGGSHVSFEVLMEARNLGVAAVVVGGFDDSDLKKLLGKDLGVAITGKEDIGITLVVTEGFGPIPMARQTLALLRSLEGHSASVNGATQIRAGVIRPEIIVPGTGGSASSITGAAVEQGMNIGSAVRIIRAPYFGEIGVVSDLPHELHMLESETKVRVVRVRLENGLEHLLPRANVEIIATDTP